MLSSAQHHITMLLAGGVCCLKRRGEWWTRLSLDLEHLGRPDESLEVHILLHTWLLRFCPWQ